MKQELPTPQLVHYRRDFLFEHGYMFCEHCGRSDQYYYEVHHIFYRSEKPKHKKLNHADNLILLCKKCHNWLHDMKARRRTLSKYKTANKHFNENNTQRKP